MKFFLVLFWVLATSFVFGQSSFTLSGKVTDVKNGESMIGAKVYVPSMETGAVTNVYGFYSLTLPNGTYEVEFRYNGYQTEIRQVDLTKGNVVLDIEIGSAVQQLGEVNVNAKKGENVNSTQMGQIEMDIKDIKKVPAFMGEVDLIKTVQLLPGVSSTQEGGQGFYVRGGGPDQNLVLLDEAVVYNAAHLFGFFSVFNADAVKGVNLIKGGMPANFGGRMSSVLEINMKEGNNKRFKATGGLGLISSRLTLEGPIKKDKGSFIVSARRTYIDVFMKAFISDTSPFRGSSYYFYDLNFKANYKITPKDHIYLSGYYGKDVFDYNNQEDMFAVNMPWGNGIASLRWNHQFNGKLFMNVTGTYTNYQFGFNSTQDQFSVRINSGIEDWGGKVDFSWYPNPRHHVKYGVSYMHHKFSPISVAAQQDTITFDTGLAQNLFSHETGVYVLDEVDMNEFIKVNYGLRYSTFTHVGPFIRYIKGNIANPDSTITYKTNEPIKTYHGLEPRVSARFLLPDKSSIKAGYSYNYQYVHLTSLSAVSLPTDVWYPATNIARPQTGWQTSIGYFRNFLQDKFETSVELYYKGMNNLIEYKEGALPSDNLNDNTDNLLTFGRGWSYGAEFFIRKTSGQLTGWIGYTWAKTERKFAEINQGKVFPAKYDRRHDLSVVGSYELNPRWSFGGAFVFATGNTLTLPSAWYLNGQDLLLEYGDRNSTRMPDYHRLDVSVTYSVNPVKQKIGPDNEVLTKNRRIKSNIVFSVFNVYNRANPFFMYIDNDGNFLDGDFKITAKQVTLFPIIPGITWNFEIE